VPGTFIVTGISVLQRRGPATLASRGGVWDHRPMRSSSRWSLVLAALVVPHFWVLPAFGAAPEAAPPRELLQPPKHSIPSPITDRFALKGIYFQPKVATQLRYDSSAGVPGTEFSAEDTLGLDDALNQGTIEMWLRMGERHRMRVDYYKMTRKGDVILDQLLQFGDSTFLPGERVVSSMDLRSLGLTSTYSLFRRETFEIGLGLGLHLLQVEGAAEVPARFAGEDFDTAGPMATLALDGTWRIKERFSVNARVQYFQGNVDAVDGSYGAYHLDVQYRWRPNFAFGLGYSQTSMKVDSTDPDFSGLFDLEYKGPEAFVRVSF
jgi:hypothetical protein